MVFTPPVPAYILSWLSSKALTEQTAFVAAYVGMSLLYSAFSTLRRFTTSPCECRSSPGGDGPRSPFDRLTRLSFPL